MDIFRETRGVSSWVDKKGWASRFDLSAINVPLENWHGVTCNSVGEVIKIELLENNLKGEFIMGFDGFSPLTPMSLLV